MIAVSGAPNTNPYTDIRYGVVRLNSLADWVFDEFLYHGTNETEAEIMAEWEAENPEAPLIGGGLPNGDMSWVFAPEGVS